MKRATTPAPKPAQFWDTTVLTCPDCGENYMHHDGLEIYHRNGEDSTDGVTISIGNLEGPKPKIECEPGISGTPSARRNGFVVVFRCEFCRRKKRLMVAQHKGFTIVEWDQKKRRRS